MTYLPQHDFDYVVNPYLSTQTIIAEQAHPAKQPKRIGIMPAMALAVAAAIGAGTITGIATSEKYSSQAGEHNLVQTLNAPVGQQAAATQPGSVQDVAAKVLPAVVSIAVISNQGASEGSGSILTSDGYILTNNHVVNSGQGNEDALIRVNLHDGRRFKATFVAGDPTTDVAVIKLLDAQDLPTMTFGDSNAVAVGQEVVAVGSPLGLQATVTSGIISALNRPVQARGEAGGQDALLDAIQTDAAINPGNSGGPLVDMQGNQIGINSMIASLPNGGNTAGSIGLGFAIPANFAKRVAQQLIETGHASQPRLGVQLAPRAKVFGALVSEVLPDSPAAAAGLQAGDVIIGLNDRQIDSSNALIAAVRSSDFGQEVTLKVVDERDENYHEVVVRLSNE
ncbi:S1C family serine protease [Corynebacterium sp. HS2168-gen11]|uniref:S1C family serine protease n=1 Tax=Corynebacterium sp. HS2168-gen11 TaxID=2974027 RepID=UPI00216B26F1|nr:trypsin-like peptidase domain-containing protein [Corynebacterium sp. HS2168-gen11]MCS4536393.1 trypsin-like peptidase domain-containing protein [Corynebacterium sp. HS2168-gen11]